MSDISSIGVVHLYMKSGMSSITTKLQSLTTPTVYAHHDSVSLILSTKRNIKEEEVKQILTDVVVPDLVSKLKERATGCIVSISQHRKVTDNKKLRITTDTVKTVSVTI